MEIFVQFRQNDKRLLKVNPYDTLLELKQKIEVIDNVPPIQQLLVFAGTPMVDDDKVLVDYKLENFSTVYLVLKLRGCSGCDCDKNKNIDKRDT
jgi:hypothetical protein